MARKNHFTQRLILVVYLYSCEYLWLAWPLIRGAGMSGNMSHFDSTANHDGWLSTKSSFSSGSVQINALHYSSLRKRLFMTNARLLRGFAVTKNPNRELKRSSRNFYIPMNSRDLTTSVFKVVFPFLARIRANNN